MNEEIKMRPVEILGMAMEEWTYRSSTAEFGTGPDWATLSFIESKDPHKGHATTLLQAAKEHYEAQGKRVGGTVALNARMTAIYKRLGYIEYDSDE
jgi:hypothetical protein